MIVVLSFDGYLVTKTVKNFAEIETQITNSMYSYGTDLANQATYLVRSYNYNIARATTAYDYKITITKSFSYSSLNLHVIDAALVSKYSGCLSGFGKKLDAPKESFVGKNVRFEYKGGETPGTPGHRLVKVQSEDDYSLVGIDLAKNQVRKYLKNRIKGDISVANL